MPLVYLFFYNATYLEWSEYKVPKSPVFGDEDGQVVYSINIDTILDSIHSQKKDIFLTEREANYSPLTKDSPSFSQTDYEEIAGELSEYVWGEPLDNWHLNSAKFLISNADDSMRIYYVELIYFQREDNQYITHDVSIDASEGKVMASENLYRDERNWKALDFDGLKINDVSQVVKIAQSNGGDKACLPSQSCNIGIWLSPSLYEYGRFLFLSLYRYEWGWNISYSNEDGVYLFDMYVDPNNGSFRVEK